MLVKYYSPEYATTAQQRKMSKYSVTNNGPQLPAWLGGYNVSLWLADFH